MTRKSKRQIERDEQIYQLGTLVAGEFSLQEVLDKLAEAAVKIVGVKACSIRLLDEEAGELKMRSTHGLSEEYRGPEVRCQLDAVQKNPVHRGRIIVVLAEANPKFGPVGQAQRRNRSVQVDIVVREPAGAQVPQVLNLVPGHPIGTNRHTVEIRIVAERVRRRSVRLIAEFHRCKRQPHIHMRRQIISECHRVAGVLKVLDRVGHLHR